MDSPDWWADWFKRGDWSAWRAFLAATFALPIEDTSIYRECTGRVDLPTEPAKEAWAICGRRGGKSRIMALVGAWLSVFVDVLSYLAPGEVGTVMIIAANKAQARSAMRYLKAFILDHPKLRQLVTREDKFTLELSNRVAIEVTTASFRTTRGYTVLAVIADELAFWMDDEESANPADEIITALRPAMATMPHSLLMVATSPYARRGPVWDAYRAHYGKDADPVLVWKAPTRTMNPGVPQAIIDDAYEKDPANAASEYGAEFRSDIEAFITREVVEAVTSFGCQERPYAAGTHYVGFVDPSGGSADSFTLAIAHKDADGRAVLDAVREKKPPFSPDQVTAEYAALLKSYRVSRVRGDRYAGEWPRERFREYGITYEPADKPKSDIYRDILPLLNSGKADLLDHSRLLAQLCGLERRTARSGKDSIDHAPGAHDDIANAVAGALDQAAGKRRGLRITDEVLASLDRGLAYARS